MWMMILVDYGFNCGFIARAALVVFRVLWVRLLDLDAVSGCESTHMS